MTSSNPDIAAAELLLAQRALYEAGTRYVITSLSEPGPAGPVVQSFFDPVRQQLIREAPWGFARTTSMLNLVGSIQNSPPNNIPPWYFTYNYPQGCLRLRYLFRPFLQPTTGDIAPGVPSTGTPIPPFIKRGPNRRHRFVVSLDPTCSGAKIVLTNLQQASAVWTMDVIDPRLWDSLFTEAFVALLAAKFIVPLSGNIKLKEGFLQLAQRTMLEARAADGNEAIPTSDHVPDFIRARGSASGWPDHSGFGIWGGEDAPFWSDFDEMDWAM